MTRSKSRVVTVAHGDGWGDRLSEAVDTTVHKLGAARDVINVALAPVAGSALNGSSPTIGVLVTVVWREP